MSGPDALGIGDFKVQLDDEVASGVAAKVATRKWRAAWLPDRVAEQPSPLEPSGSSAGLLDVGGRGRLHRRQRCTAAHLRQPGRVLRTPGITAIPELKEGYVHG